MAQRISTIFLGSAHPLTHRAFGHPEGLRDVLLFPALLLQLPATIVKNIEILYQSYFLPQFVDHGRLTDTAQELTSMMREEPAISLANVAKSCDHRLGVKRGSSLQVAYYLIATRQWRIDISQPLDAAKPLQISGVALQTV